jgi:creatine kinase/arginine kinase
LFKEGDRFLEACGLNRDWPDGRGIFHNNEKTFLVWVNEEDQLRIISMQQGADIGAVFTRLSKACSHIETVAKFSHDEHLGYITSCPTNLGTALRASVHIQLPYLG